MIQIFTDGALAYDSRVEHYALEGLQITTGLNVGGTATITLNRDHPAYNSFVSHRTIVTIYRDGALRFRGRALYPADNFNGRRTITCEGELCLLGDGIHRPYLYQAEPGVIFRQVIQNYNDQMTNYGFKQFKVGRVTVTDSNDYLRLESEKPETHQAVINKLLERVGGYITFTDAADGSREINWVATLDRESGQSIEFGENLLDYTSTGANNTEFATTVIPYGAKDEETGKRLTIESVNGGKDYVTDEEAKAIYGNVVVSVTWDDVTKPENLLRKARAYLDTQSVLITSLELTALDLSYLDKDMDSFAVGDLIRVISRPHGVNDFFQLSQMTEDLLNPANSRIVLGKDVPTLTGADVAGDNKGQAAVASAKEEIKSDVNAEMQQAASQLEEVLAPKLAQNVETAVLQKVSQDYAPRAELEALAESTSQTLAQHETAAVETFATKAELATHEQNAQEAYATKTALATHEKNAQEAYATKKSLSLYKQEVAETYATKEELEGLTPGGSGEPSDLSAYATKAELAAHEEAAAATYATKEELGTEVSARAGVINKVDGTVHISGGAPINILGGKIDIDGSEINFKKEARFLNESGIRIADNAGNQYYVLRVDASNNCFVGNDYSELYLRAKTAVYLHKTGATVTSDRRQKNSIEALPEAYTALLDKLTPVRFRYNDRGDKYHVGFIAQDVEQALKEAGLSSQDFGGFVDVTGDGSNLGLAYDEFIGLLLEKIRRLEKRIEAMEG